MSRGWSKQESSDTGISWELAFPDITAFKQRLILRNTYADNDYTYIFNILDSLLFDKVFRFTSIHRCVFHISTKVEVLLKMSEQFNTKDGTDYRVYNSNTSFATYEEEDELDIDNLNIDDDNKERIGNRESGSKSKDESYNYSINEIINREKRIHDYITKEIIPLFSARTKHTRRENYE